MPEKLYFNAKTPKFVHQYTGPIINNHTALENMYRLNMGGRQLSVQDDTGMYRSWVQDSNYIYGAAVGLTPLYQNPIMYTKQTPNYTAPEEVYQTQRSMGVLSDKYNLTWILPVDSGFYYMLRLHFCNIIPQYTKASQVIFRIFINNQTAEQEADVFYWTKGSGYPVFKDYIVFVNDPDGTRSKQDLWLALHPNPNSEQYLDAYLNGLEVFKLSMNKNLASPNPELSSITRPARRTPTVERNKKTQYAAIIGGLFVLVIILLVLIVLRQRRQVQPYAAAHDMSSYGPAYSESGTTKSSNSTLPSAGYHRFTLTGAKATKAIVSIKRVNPSSTTDDDEYDGVTEATKLAGRSD
ncbi:receptor-like protein kinase FERONIA [Bidens hawaiensis]|uniref:receptor-like protein kinase FERONIA n=1 Tax=Bidens hawaiensis TaxID=980011 RepID=UPI00404B9E8B